MKTFKTTISEYTIKKNKSNIAKTKITSSKDASEYIRKFYFDDIGIYESFFILCLNTANNTVGYAKISQGGTAGTVVDIKIIAKFVIDNLAHGIILAHNHPSGRVKPSGADKELTLKIKSALELLEVKVLDHIIIAEDDYFSFADDGLL